MRGSGRGEHRIVTPQDDEGAENRTKNEMLHEPSTSVCRSVSFSEVVMELASAGCKEFGRDGA